MEKLKRETIDSTIKDIRDLFRPEKENNAIKGTIVKYIRNLIRLEKENKVTEHAILRYIWNLFENEEEEKNHYKAVRVSNIWSNNYIEYGSTTKILSVKEYLNKIRPYLKNIINNLKKSDTCKFQLTIENDLISSTDNDEGHVMHSKSGNIEIMINDEVKLQKNFLNHSKIDIKII